MADNGFVPLAPRRLQRASDPENMANENADAGRDAALPRDPPVERGPVIAEVPERTDSDEVKTEVAAFAPAPDPTGAHTCAGADFACVRDVAIQFAAAACARALRYAVDRNPRLLARFVDEALRAAGGPHNAVVRVAPAATVAGAESKEHDFVADPSLSPGDVFIDCAAGTIGATLEERAELLVRAAAS